MEEPRGKLWEMPLLLRFKAIHIFKPSFYLDLKVLQSMGRYLFNPIVF